MMLVDRWRRLVAGDGILATKFGYNPNSSSLGVDVTFLLFGISAIAMLTPVISLLVRGGGAAIPAPEAKDLPAEPKAVPTP